MTNNDSVWDVLGKEAGDAGQVFRRLHPDSPRNITARFDLSSRRPSLALDLIWSVDAELPSFTQSRVIEAKAQPLEEGTRLRVSLELEDEAFHDVFVTLTSDVAAMVAKAGTDADALQTFELRVEQWREMLEGIGRGGLPTLARRGLFGELHVLRTYLIPSLGTRRALEAWTGPQAANQDFQFPGGAIEVKTTSGKQPQALVVANERELDPRGAGRLFLLHLSLDERRGGTGECLNDTVASVDALLDNDLPSRRLLIDGLHRVGYLTAQAELYAEPRYELRSESLFEVGEDFPRIVENDLRPGVGAVRYDVSLSACLPYAADVASLLALLTQSEGASVVDGSA